MTMSNEGYDSKNLHLYKNLASDIQIGGARDADYAKAHNEIQSEMREKYIKIEKKAHKLAQLTWEKYGKTLPLHLILSKIKTFKEKFKLSNDEFRLFQKMYEKYVSQNYLDYKPSLNIPNTMVKLLGPHSSLLKQLANKQDDRNYRVLQEIQSLHMHTKILHGKTVIQSVNYKTCGIPFDKSYNYVSDTVGFDFVHPVLFALFVPKIQFLEEHFVFSSLSDIIDRRARGEPITNPPDNVLVESLLTDNNDVVCNSDMPLVDILNRVSIQVNLWTSIIYLRAGKFLNVKFRDFLSSIDNCRFNKYDDPNIIHGKNEAIILKKLFNAFSFRPTIVYSLFQNNLNFNPYYQTIVPNVSVIATIDIHISAFVDNNVNGGINLEKFVSNESEFMINGTIIPRTKAILYSNLLVFYINRKTLDYKFTSVGVERVVGFNQLPVAIAGFERLNTREINYGRNVPINNDLYSLQSIVYAKTTNVNGENDIVLGTGSMVYCTSDINNASLKIYDPIEVAQDNGLLSDLNRNLIEPDVYTETCVKMLENTLNTTYSFKNLVKSIYSNVVSGGTVQNVPEELDRRDKCLNNLNMANDAIETLKNLIHKHKHLHVEGMRTNLEHKYPIKYVQNSRTKTQQIDTLKNGK